MADPDNATKIPHLLGITLDGDGVAQTIVVAVNRRTGERLRVYTNASKVAIIDAANFSPSGYNADDVIEFINSGASVGEATITINSATGGFQEVEIDCAAGPTVAVNL